MRAVCVRGRHFNGRQPSDLHKNVSTAGDVILGGGGGGGAYARDKNTSVGICTKNAGGVGGLCARGAYLRDTTVFRNLGCMAVHPS